MDLHVLVPVDGSAESDAALDHALDHHPDARLTILHVLNPASAFGYGDDEYFDVEGYQAEVERRRERAEDLLAEYEDTARERGADVDTRLETGIPAGRILATIEDAGVDHVVMGSRGRSGVGRVLFGSVAETVTRRASVPVTIVR